jgi:regulation of enolase protein 1 (concanavalin A-like superfamily)
VVGVFACSPERAGFQARFSEFEVGAPEEGALY